MRAAEASAGAIERFDNCGGSCEVWISRDGQRAKLSARYCHSRFCVPCMKARARVIRDNLLRWLGHVDPLMITLTLQDQGHSLKYLLDHLLKSFARLRAHEGWKDRIDAGAYCVEITRGEKKDHWHVHLHAICVGAYYPYEELSDAWRRASRGSYIVHVTRASKSKRGVEYASEYASKGWASDCLEDQAWIVELMAALRSRRLLGTFGGWRGRGVELDADTSHEYRHLGNLVEIVRHAARGEQWAIGICRLLGVAVISDAGQVNFVRLRRAAAPAEQSTDPPPLVT